MKRALMFPVLLILLATMARSGRAGEGGSGSHGGGAIVCSDGDGKIVSAKLLDLREAEKQGMTIPRSDEPAEVQLERALAKLHETHAVLATKMRQVLRTMKIVLIPAGERLPPPTDTNIRVLKEPRNCSLEGVAAFDDKTEELSIDGEIEAAMSRTDLAALYFHEAVYRVYRQSYAQTRNSLKARKLTGTIFSDAPLVFEKQYAGEEAAISFCETKDKETMFHVIPQADGSHRIQFIQIRGTWPTEKTYFDIPKENEATPLLALGLVRVARDVRDSDNLPDRFKQNWFERWTQGIEYWGKSFEGWYRLQSTYGPDDWVYFSTSKGMEMPGSSVIPDPLMVENGYIEIGIGDPNRVWNQVRVSCRALK